ncbi:hypothetical protein IP81_17470 [Novosphingobium sp. AAP83]|uniref:hypothetical protein n=1 Tax=Novosphingobium sp. AAP83 TaxID=1523425 RepID=UPI0006B88E92|nr:hypothetical protein [Novosphingobium sp. AAP83]KPF89029.1 hypothetical protein IP81_17470 [Novosphingobium sp. AAP83]
MKEVEDDLVRVRILPDRRVNRRDAGVILGREPKTLAEWKMKGWGPKSISVGGREFYNYDECLAMGRGELPIKPRRNV